MATTTKLRKTPAKVSHAIQPPQIISEIHLISLERIEIYAQVRTEFNQESIEELAADIEQHGLLQPVLVNPIGDERYRLVCGERRLRAIQHLGQKAIPAVITKMDEDAISLAQLAENIQREDMSLADQCAAIRKLYDLLGSFDAVAARVKKSKSWVSKRVGLTMDGYSVTARNLVIDGVTTDLEILGAIDQAEKINYYEATRIANAVRNGATRQTARDMLAEAKAGKEKNEQYHREEAAALQRQREERENAPPAPPPPFNPDRAIRLLNSWCDGRSDEIQPSYTLEEVEMIEVNLSGLYAAGEQASASGNGIQTLIREIMDIGDNPLQLAALLHGYFKSPLELPSMLANAIQIEETTE